MEFKKRFTTKNVGSDRMLVIRIKLLEFKKKSLIALVRNFTFVNRVNYDFLSCILHRTPTEQRKTKEMKYHITINWANEESAVLDNDQASTDIAKLPRRPPCYCAFKVILISDIFLACFECDRSGMFLTHWKSLCYILHKTKKKAKTSSQKGDDWADNMNKQDKKRRKYTRKSYWLRLP